MSEAAEPAVREVETPHGPARVHLHGADAPRAGLVLGHGAGGGVGSRDLTLATRVALELGVSVALVEQPYRVAGRRGPSPAKQLDAAWTAVAADLRAGELAGLPVIAGGRSSGARVACRTAAAVGAAGVLCLAFPLVPPGRGDRASRLPELEGVEVPVLVVQGRTDAFGIPPEAPSRRVVLVTGDHSLRSDTEGLTTAVRAWLEELLGPRAR
jgi:predicted alpha/beta-hydrolase family hydrolase